MSHAKIAPTHPTKKIAETDQQEPLLAVLVAELPEQGRSDRGDEQERGEDPGRPRGRRVQVALQARQRRHHHRLLERVRKRGQGEDGERDVVVLAVSLHRLEHNDEPRRDRPVGQTRCMRAGGIVGLIRSAVVYLRDHPRVTKSLQAFLVALTLGICGFAIVDQWHKAGPRLAHAKPGYLVLAFVTIAAYYLVFIFGWIRMLEAWGIRVTYRVALQAEMVSMLAKYLPGGVWTPAARTVALRRSGE